MRRLVLALCTAIGTPAADSLPGDRVIRADADVVALAFVDAGAAIAGQCGDGKLRVWDRASGALLRTLEQPGQFRGPFTFLAASSQLARTTRDGAIQIFDTSAGKLARQVPAAASAPGDIALSGDGALVATAHTKASDNTILVRDASGVEKHRLPAGLGGISILGFSPDGGQLVAGSYDTDLRIWNTRNGELAARITELPVSMFAMSFSPDGRLLATAGADRIVYLWDTRTWKLARRITGQPEMISALEFSPDGRLLVTGGFSELTVRAPVQVIVWDTATGRQLRTMRAAHRVTVAAFSPDGKTVAAAYRDKSVDLWQVPR